MKVKSHKLYNNDGSAVAYAWTKNKSGKLENDVPRFVVIHFTVSGTARGTVSWLKNPDAKASAHVVVGHDGALTQMVRFNERAWHAGHSSWKGLTGLNKYAIGIEIVNWGPLLGDWGRWRSSIGNHTVQDDRVMIAAHRNSQGNPRGWEIFDEAQIDAAAGVVRALVDAYGIERVDVIGHDDIAPDRKEDPGPAWDMQRFRGRVFGRQEDSPAIARFEVTAQSGLNMRAGPGIDHGVIKLLERGVNVSVVEKNALWWMVAELSGDQEGDTGWVHSRWLAEV